MDSEATLFHNLKSNTHRDKTLSLQENSVAEKKSLFDDGEIEKGNPYF